jgi:acetyltransferase-like isoleucine patch superfamily enzyme
MTIRCHLDRISPESIAGWAWDPDDPEAAIIVDVFYGERTVGSVEASLYRRDLEQAKFKQGRCAFDLRCPPGLRIEEPGAVRALFRHPGQNEIRCELRGQQLEDDGWVDFGNDPSAVLKPLGLEVTCLRGKQKLGRNTSFEAPVVVLAHIAPETNVQVGAFTGVYGSLINRCQIGRYCSIAPNVVIGPNEHPMDWLTSSIVAEHPQHHGWDQFIDPSRVDFFRKHQLRFDGNSKQAVIGNDVWLGNGVFVRSGVTIGDGAVVGAGSVVVSDIPAYAVAVGSPAKVKRMRFDERTVARLQAARWWRYSLYDLVGTRFDRVDEALSVIEDRLARDELQEYRPEVYTPARLRQILAKAKPSDSRATIG